MFIVYLLSFILLVGILVFVHEFGHFITGKLLGVRVEAFSIGFGKALLKKKVGETEYRISLVPLGGYVKFYGENEVPDPHLNTFDFNAQKVWKRALIVSAGPIFNLLFACMLFAAIYFVGEPNVSSVVGYVDYESPAWVSGIRRGDEIVSINGEKVSVWNDVIMSSAGSENNELILNVKRGDRDLQIKAPLIEMPTINEFGETIFKKQVAGIYPYSRSSVIGISDPASFAFKQGLRSNDIIFSVADKKIGSWNELEDVFLSKKGTLKMKIKRKEQELTLMFNNDFKYNDAMERVYKTGDNNELTDHYYGVLNQMGIFPSDLVVASLINEKMAAGVAGIKPGDRLVAVNNVIVRSFAMLQRIIDQIGREGNKLKLSVEREGTLMSFDIKPGMEDIKEDETGIKVRRYLLGIQTSIITGPASTKKLIIRNPVDLLVASASKTAHWTQITLVGFFKLFTGKVSMKAIGGPILIGKIAGDSITMGFIYFLKLMSIISINLALINLFPIPILDGGHLVFFGVEAVLRKPLGKKYMEAAQQVGFYILVGLMVLAFYNDILRYSGPIIGMFK